MRKYRDASDLDRKALGPLFQFVPRADDTKRESYERIKGMLPELEQLVYEKLKEGEMTNMELAHALGYADAVFHVTRQTFNLRDRGLVVPGSKRKDPKSGRTVQAWRIKQEVA
jgi:hypothetical protein